MPFCKLHLPNKDATVVLENEEGEEFPIKYIAHKTGLSAGWRKFVTGNKLLEGDVVVFQLVAPCRFKVMPLYVYTSTGGWFNEFYATLLFHLSKMILADMTFVILMFP